MRLDGRRAAVVLDGALALVLATATKEVPMSIPTTVVSEPDI